MDLKKRPFRSRAAALLAAIVFFSLPGGSGGRAADSRFPSPGSSVQPQPSSSSATAPASTASSQSVSDFEQRLSRINGQIKDLKARIEAEARKESSVLSSLARVNLNKSLVQKELAAQNVELERARAELAAIQADIRVIRSNLDRERESIERTLVTLYKFGRLDFFQFLLQARNIETYASESKNLSILARARRRSSPDSSAPSTSCARPRPPSTASRGTSPRWSGPPTSRSRSSRPRPASTPPSSRRSGRTRTTFKQTLEELSESAEELQKMMNKIINQEWVLPAAFVPLYERRGQLPWPLEGKVITAFGFERHPDFKTMVMNKGVEISPAKDKSLILAVHTGKVVYADYFQGYGNLLIVDHGMTYYSLYGHCAEFLVAVGDMVRAGQPVAMVGDTGSLKGECLYFEIRYKTKALDPLQWLKRR